MKQGTVPRFKKESVDTSPDSRLRILPAFFASLGVKSDFGSIKYIYSLVLPYSSGFPYLSPKALSENTSQPNILRSFLRLKAVMLNAALLLPTKALPSSFLLFVPLMTITAFPLLMLFRYVSS